MVNKTLKKHKKGDRFAMCIPCHSEDSDCIDKCFKSIKEQEQKPDIITMSVSSSTPEKEALFNQKKAEYKLPIHYSFTTEPLLPGANRNRAAAAAIKKGATHLSFFDADDIMHPKRFKLIRKAFSKNKGMTGVVHGFQGGSKANSTLTTPNTPVNGAVHFNRVYPKVESNQEGIPYNTIAADPQLSNSLASGHSTVTSKFWKLYPFREDLKTGEDGSFIHNILTKGTLGFMTDPLTLYLR